MASAKEEYIEKKEQDIKKLNDERRALDIKYISSIKIEERKKLHEEIMYKMDTIELLKKEIIRQQQLVNANKGGASKNKSRKSKRSYTRKHK